MRSVPLANLPEDLRRSGQLGSRAGLIPFEGATPPEFSFDQHFTQLTWDEAARVAGADARHHAEGQAAWALPSLLMGMWNKVASAVGFAASQLPGPPELAPSLEGCTPEEVRRQWRSAVRYFGAGVVEAPNPVERLQLPDGFYPPQPRAEPLTTPPRGEPRQRPGQAGWGLEVARSRPRVPTPGSLQLMGQRLQTRPFDWSSSRIPPRELQGSYRPDRPGQAGWGIEVTRSRPPVPTPGSLQWMGQRLRPRPFDWSSPRIPPRELQGTYRPDRPGQAGWGMEVARSRPPVSTPGSLEWMGQGLR